METCKLCSSNFNEIRWCNHSNETFLAVLLHTIGFSIFLKQLFFLNFDLIGTPGR